MQMETQMLTSEPSYFDFLMKNRSLRGARVPFAQAAGVLPELAHVVRVMRANGRVATNTPSYAAG